jgi:hypothetical protein
MIIFYKHSMFDKKISFIARWKIEKVFDFLKNKLKLKHIHTYTKIFIYKHVYLNVLLMKIPVNKGYNGIKEIIKLVDFT